MPWTRTGGATPIPEEAPRHYIDIDHYAHAGEDPFAVVPRTWDMAVQKFTEDTLKAYGIVPWHVQVMHGRLVQAFKRGDVDRILRHAADLGHYVGDAHVPCTPRRTTTASSPGRWASTPSGNRGSPS